VIFTKCIWCTLIKLGLSALLFANLPPSGALLFNSFGGLLVLSSYFYIHTPIYILFFYKIHPHRHSFPLLPFAGSSPATVPLLHSSCVISSSNLRSRFRIWARTFVNWLSELGLSTGSTLHSPDFSIFLKWRNFILLYVWILSIVCKFHIFFFGGVGLFFFWVGLEFELRALLEPYFQSMLLWLFWRWGLKTISLDWLQTSILPISDSQEARITGVSHWRLAVPHFLYYWLFGT
jgi:hypothetical protein